MIAYDFPLAGVFWTLMMLFLWIAWFAALLSVIGDIFRSDDHGGAAKAAWTVAVVIIPLIGLTIYLVSRGDGMHARKVAEDRAKQAATDEYLREVSAPADPAEELALLGELLSHGVITSEEYERQKVKTLA